MFHSSPGCMIGLCSFADTAVKFSFHFQFLNFSNNGHDVKQGNQLYGNKFVGISKKKVFKS